MFGAFTKRVYSLDGSTGVEEWSYSVGDYVWSTPLISDVNGDGVKEVVVGCDDGYVYCLDGRDGGLVWRFSVGFDVFSSPAAADVDGDGAVEVVFGARDFKVHVVDGATGSEEWSWTASGAIYSSPALADLDGDGVLEIVVGDYTGKVYALDGRGELQWTYSTGDEYVHSSAALANVDGDGVTEAVVGYGTGGFVPSGIACVDGLSGADEWNISWGEAYTPGCLVDIDGDGEIEFLAPAQSSDQLKCLDARTGAVEWSITLRSDVHSLFAADVDGDNCAEVLTGTGDGDGSNALFVIDDPADTSDCGALGTPSSPARGGVRLLFDGAKLRLLSSDPFEGKLTLYDAQGRLVRTLWEGRGVGSFEFELRLLPGVYIARFAGEGEEALLKFIISP